ncbi:MAG: aspartate carbamoyltransferase catalytic subunit [Coxiellaceae bacterium]|nr:aspartate carbamoyltransferase catalytic subunit [Coxiellaceae bacterium]
MKKINLPIHHLVDMDSLDQDIIQQLFKRAQYFLDHCINKGCTLNTLENKLVANLFFETSTRTRSSFTIAAKRLGALILNPNMSQTAIAKGESLLDTIHSLEAMGVDLFVIRHTDNNTASFVASELSTDAAVINAGDGNNQHPTQCLLDLFTISRHKNNFADIKVSIIGDILHSRVARSLVDGLRIMGTTNINLIAPAALTPSETDNYKDVTIHHSMEEGLNDADVVVALRIQKERMQEADMPDPEKFYREFGLTPSTLSFAKPDAIVMHPGPLNRGVEIDSSVADGPQSVILEQVRNGVAIRMALMDGLLN